MFDLFDKFNMFDRFGKSLGKRKFTFLSGTDNKFFVGTDNKLIVGR